LALLDVWIPDHGDRVFVYLSVRYRRTSRTLRTPEVAMVFGFRIPAEAPLQQQVAIRIRHFTHSQLTLFRLYSLCLQAFSLLFCFLHSNVGQCQWSGPMEGEWSSAGAEALAHGCRGSQAALSSPIQDNSTSLTMLSRPIRLLTCQHANANDNDNYNWNSVADRFKSLRYCAS